LIFYETYKKWQFWGTHALPDRKYSAIGDMFYQDQSIIFEHGKLH
jgi:hypothetical protein